ncbi:MAG: hypothetical protein HUU38_05245 [Anaerolineales bacterium]|nr:hypothetical protein [Anaerolineales bacterium]
MPPSQRHFRALLPTVILLVLLTACQSPPTPSPFLLITPSPLPLLTPSPMPLGAGFRYSSYGPPYDPGPDYWASTGQQMAAKFPDAVPATLWIVGVIYGNGTYLNFPLDEEIDAVPADVRFSYVDLNEDVLTRFDEMGGQVWLQVEPGNADVVALIHAMLARYGHHPSVVGVGVDVEWYQSTTSPVGERITDEVAAAWVAAARAHGERFRVFLKHWEIDWMPPTYRDGLLFVNDSQQFASLDAMLADFTAWGEHFAPAPVGFQFGYPADRPWWGEYPDPPAEIGNALLQNIPNTESLFWVDFTILDVFPDK